jgi:hypothetical protein
MSLTKYYTGSQDGETLTVHKTFSLLRVDLLLSDSNLLVLTNSVTENKARDHSSLLAS